MLAHITRELAELGIILHEPFHISDRLDIRSALRFGLVLLHIFFDILPQITKVLVHILLKKWVLILSQDNLLELWSDVWHILQIHPAIIDTKQFMNHSLIRPLSQQWGDGIIAAVKNE